MRKGMENLRVPPVAGRRALGILARILCQPTAPFHEHRVRGRIQAELDRIGIPWRLDAAGNLQARYRAGRARPVSFLAHMDHPGFEVASVEGRRALARWKGQVPTFDLKGLRLALWSDDPGTGRRGTAVVLKGDGRPGPGNVVDKEIRLAVPAGAQPGDFGYADLVPFRLRGGRVVSKALDNVAGCGAMVACLDHLVRHRLPGDIRLLFTRAEEVGFHGALAAIRTGSLPQGRPLVVLECSRAMPGAAQGLGPVIRVGDRARVFDPDVAAACEEAVRALQRRQPRLRIQRRLMDGGVCEATAFGLAGYRAVCLAFPLGNYHNVAAAGIRPEFIHAADFLGGVACLGAFAALGLDPHGTRRRLAAWARGRFRAADLARLRRTRQVRRARIGRIPKGAEAVDGLERP